MSVIFILSLDFIKSSFNQPTRFYKSAGKEHFMGNGPAQHATRQHVDPKIILLFPRFIWTGVQQVHFYFILLCIPGSPANEIILKMVQKSFVSGVSLIVCQNGTTPGNETVGKRLSSFTYRSGHFLMTKGPPIRERGVGATSQSYNNIWTPFTEYNPELQRCWHSSLNLPVNIKKRKDMQDCKSLL